MLIGMAFARQLGNDHVLKALVFAYLFEKLTVSLME